MYVWKRIVEVMRDRKYCRGGSGKKAQRKVALQTQIGLPSRLTLSKDVVVVVVLLLSVLSDSEEIHRISYYQKRNKSTFVRAAQTRMTTKRGTEGTVHKTHSGAL